MSRAVDLLLLLLIGVVAFFLWRGVGEDEESSPTIAAPLEVTLRVTGEVPLDGLGLLVSAVDSTAPAGDATTRPLQLTPFTTERTTRVRVPSEGSYRVRWGVRDGAVPPLPPTAFDGALPEGVRADGEVVEVDGTDPVGVIEIGLDAALADALRASALGR